MLLRLVSGGQTGADRAALDVAIKHNFPHGGWCPKGRKAEDGAISRDYVLAESPSANYLQRTEWNARDANGTVIFTMSSVVTGGSRRTVDFALKHTRPWIHLHPQMQDDPSEVLLEFIQKHQIQTLNVAGSRGSKEPQLYAWVCKVLETSFFATEAQRAIPFALQHLGPEIAVTEVIDNAEASLVYDEKLAVNCWRIYFEPRFHEPAQLGRDSPYILIEKETNRFVGRGVVRNE